MSALGHEPTCALHKRMSASPNNDRESEIPQKAMSALAPKADMCGATSLCLLWAKSGHRRCAQIFIPSDEDCDDHRAD
jgi:hypothetical protein